VVDFGSSHAVTVVHLPGAAPRLVPVDGDPWLPSAVFLSRDDMLVVGNEALRLAAADPSRLESRGKARIAEREVLLGDTVVPVQTLVLAVLVRAVRAASAVAGAIVDHLVLTHPADWGPDRRGALLAAADGVAPRVSTLVEPVGAGVWFATRGRTGVDGAERFPLGAVLAVLDLGGGTCDVAVVRREPTGIAVVRSESIPDLGGEDFDRRLADHLRATVPGLAARLADVSAPGPARQRELVAFRHEVRTAKELLSRHERVRVRLPGGLPAATLTRADLERVLHRDLDRITAFTLRAVLRAGVEAHQLTALQLAGGSTRIPLLRRLLAEVVPAPILLDDQPEAVVALGACAVAVSHSEPGEPVPAEPPPPEAPAERPPAPRRTPAAPVRGRARPPVLALVVAAVLAVAGIGYGVARPAEEAPGQALASADRFTLPTPARGDELVSPGVADDGLVTGRTGIPVRMSDGVTDADWTVRELLDPVTPDDLPGAAPPAGTRWVLADTRIRARRAAEAPYFLEDTYLADDRGLLIPPVRGVPLPSRCEPGQPAELSAGESASQCLLFAVSVRTPVRAVVISTVVDGEQAGVRVPVEGSTPAAETPPAQALALGVIRPLWVGDVAVRVAIVDVVTNPGAYADAGVVDRPGSRAVLVRAVAETSGEVAVRDLVGRLELRDDRLQAVFPRRVSDRQGCVAGTATGRFTVCAVFVVPAATPLGTVAWSGNDAEPFFWRLR
jgi:hypothetical protein